jgi:putative transposase
MDGLWAIYGLRLGGDASPYRLRLGGEAPPYLYLGLALSNDNNAKDRQMNNAPHNLPRRKRLPHEIPGWVPDGARYFITINGRQRGQNQLAQVDIAGSLIEGVHVYETNGHWYPWQVVIMPDHLHMILSVQRDHGLKRTIAAWKGFFAKRCGIQWQSGFFEHRLRSDDEWTEKAAYIRMNPVRKELVTQPEDWPYRWERPRLGGDASPYHEEVAR